MITKRQRDLNKLLNVSSFYVSKELFNHNLTVPEIKLFIILNSKQKTEDGNKFTVNTLNKKLKSFIDSGTYYKIPSYAEKLKELKLINEDGTGKKLEGSYVMFPEFPVFKSIRQLFLLCLEKWSKRGNVFVSVSMFKGMFGEKTQRANESWKRANEQLKTNYSYCFEKGKVVIRNLNKKTKESQLKQTDNVDRKLWYREVYLKSDHWTKLSKEMRDKYKKCQICGSTKFLNVHHNNYDNLYNEKETDLIVLCNNCHELFHKNKKLEK